MRAKDIMASITSFILLCLIHYSTTHELIDPEDLSKEQKDCLFNCLMCTEVYRTQYDGETCATACVETNGETIDTECNHFGVFVAKRYKIIQAMDKCKKRCTICVGKYSAGLYNSEKCLATCDETKGVAIDDKCSKHLAVYKLLMNYHYQD